MKTAFLILLFLHGIIHSLGFLKAFHIVEVESLSLNVTKFYGTLWLICALLFLGVFVLIALNYSLWQFIALMAVIFSQILVIIFWQDAKFASCINLAILLVSISDIGKYQFEKMVQKEQERLIATISGEIPEMVGQEDLSHLPNIVKKWLMDSRTVGKSDIFSVHLTQKGEMKSTPDGRWKPFIAEQYFNVKDPAFIWSVEVSFFPGIYFTGLDKLKNGEGEMQIKLLSLINVVDERNNEKVNTGTLIRFLGELCWLPSAALNKYIVWEAIEATSAKATFSYNNYEVSGLFIFDDTGELKSFEAERFYGAGKNARQEKWVIEVISYKVFEGIKVPSVCDVTWGLDEGDFTWLKLEVTSLNFNIHPVN